MEKQVKVLEKLLSNGFPHAVLLTGPSGSGKTTTARILRRRLKCGKNDFHDINAALTRGIDTIREIASRVGQSPWQGDSRIWLFDEAANLTGESQEALLKLLEDPPSHAYFFLATTDPNKLRSTIHTRCTEVRFKLLSDQELISLVHRVLDQEKAKLSDIVIEKIVQVSEGSARKVLVNLEKVYRLDSEEDQIEVIESSQAKKQGFDIAQALFSPKKGTWGHIREIINNLQDKPETVRLVILGYATSVLLGNDARQYSRALLIIRTFEAPLYGNEKAGLAANCYDLVKS